MYGDAQQALISSSTLIICKLFSSLAGWQVRVPGRVTDADRRHFDFVQTLRRISDELTEEETADVKLFCGHLIPRGQAEQLRRAVDVFQKLIHLDKIDQENLDFLEEILERIGRIDLIRDVLRRLQRSDREIPENRELQPPDREIPANPELQPENPDLQPENPDLHPENPDLQPENPDLHPENPDLQPENPDLQPENPDLQQEDPEVQSGQNNAEGANEEGNATSDIYVVVHGQVRMIQEALDRLKGDLARLSGTRRSQVMYRGHKKHKSILVHFSIPRENTAVLRHMADHSDPRLVYMGVKSLQIDAEVPIKVQQGAPLYGGPGDVGDKLGGDLTVQEEDKRSARQDSGIGREDVLGSEAPMQERHTAGIEVTASEDMDQQVITFGGGGSKPGKFSYPRGVVVSPSNEIFVVDELNRRVQVNSTEGVYLRYFPTVVPGTGGKDMEPHDVCMDGNGTLWVVGEGGSADHVVQYSTDGTAMAGFDLKKINYSRGIAVDMRTYHILVTDADQGEVHVFRPDGSLVRTVRHPRAGKIRPRYVTVDGEGNILVSDWYNNYVYVYDEFGKFLFQFGGKGSGEGQLMSPRGICRDSSGHILVADSGNERVQIFTRHGEFVRTVRTGFKPTGLAEGPEGQLVVTGYLDHTVTIYPNY
uniref:DED domain-containing protein n=1 Tax=Branchiostoma floridae TaxID=7739 RepID=C3ZZ66_BRAFL|eukprot:XP_002586166.1 hypothetical protein BRAFLDRAFT_109861 [Branchiostoma floridae]